MGGIVKMVRELQSSVRNLETKIQSSQKDEIKEILTAQQVIDQIIVANPDAIKRIDREIIKVQNENIEIKQSKEALGKVKRLNKTDDKIEEIENKNKDKKCRYYDSGHCKYKSKCCYIHSSKEVCQHYYFKC